MPSYRLELEIGDLHRDRTPDQVMTAAVCAVGHHVDATDIAVAAGTARILVRFTVPASSSQGEDTDARQAMLRVREAVDEVAFTGRQWILRRHRGSWLDVG